jgi:hypothetical protein
MYATLLRLIRMAIVVAALILSISATSTAALASGADTTPPSAPYIIHAQGYHCLQLIVGVQRPTDDVTPQPALTYDVLATGSSVGRLTDRGADGRSRGHKVGRVTAQSRRR